MIAFRPRPHSGPAVRVLILGLCAIAGCQYLREKPYPPDLAVGLYGKAQLTYESTVAGRTTEDSAMVQISDNPGTELANFESSSVPGAAPPIPTRSKCVLSLNYPHPDGRQGVAQAVVVVEGQGGRLSGPQVLEVRVLDISKTELDATLRALGDMEFHGHGKSSRPESYVATDLDGVKTGKKWTQLPELELLIARVRTSGQSLPLSPSRG